MKWLLLTAPCLLGTLLVVDAAISCADGDDSEACRIDVDTATLLQSRTKVELPHDEDVTECDRDKPAPPVVGIWPSADANRFDSPSDPKVIVDVGGNVGGDTSIFLEKHPQAKIFTFEPVPDLFNGLKTRFAKNSNVKVQNVGLADTSRQDEFTIEGGAGIGSSGEDHSIKGKHVQVQLHDVHAILTQIQQETGQVPDLFSMNCEGCEYAVTKRMAETGWLGKIPFVQLSWHLAGDVKDRVDKRCAVEKKLWETHTRIFQSSFGWVGWQLAHT